MPIRKIAKMLFVAALVLVICAPASFAQEEKGKQTVITAGSETFNQSDVLRLIAGDAYGNDMMVMMMLGQSSLDDRRQIATDISEALLFAEGAKGEKLHEQQDVVFQIRWQTIQILIQAYFDKVSQAWDFSQAAAERYYNSHKSDFTQEEAVNAAHILTSTESDALMTTLEATAQPINSDLGWVDLGWVEKGMLVPEVEKAIMDGKSGQIVGPVQSEYGWHVIMVGEHRPARQLTFEESANAVMDGMQTEYIENELAKLRGKYPVTIDDEALKTLGDVQPPETAPVK